MSRSKTEYLKTGGWRRVEATRRKGRENKIPGFDSEETNPSRMNELEEGFWSSVRQ